MNITNEIKFNSFLDNKKLWFLNIYKGRYIITISDLNKLLGFEVNLNNLYYEDNFNRRDWNALGRGELRNEFEIINNVHYEDETIFFVYLSGFLKILRILLRESIIDEIDINKIIHTMIY